MPADATQWTDKALGRNLDESLCHDRFFAPDAGAYVNPDEARWIREFDALKGKHGPWATLRRRVLVRVMTRRRKEIWRAAQPDHWDVRNRRKRYEALRARTGG